MVALQERDPRSFRPKSRSMSQPTPSSDPQRHELLQKIVGYFNFSEGTPDVAFLANVSMLFRLAEESNTHPTKATGREGQPEQDSLATLVSWLRSEIEQLETAGGAFADCSQARNVIKLAVDHFRPAYREFHRDLFWHRSPAELWRPFFFCRVVEVILAQGPPWEEAERIVTAARDVLDDYIGYRPVATLEGSQKIEPYRNEWVRPIPLYVEGAGVAHGPYAELIESTLNILRGTDAALLREAWLDPELIEELAVDPRAYDFDHPAGKRPNHHFGQWDPNRIDNRGFYRRFVLQPIVLSSLMHRVETAASDSGSGSFTREELLFEAATVLAGTMLMASGTSGDGPGRHSSEVTLSTLLPHIAQYRDAFYEQMLASAAGPHGDRLRDEAKRLRQPFAGARQHLNGELARRRAEQMQHVHLAQLFARMGYPQAALKQARTVRVASARMLSQIYCRLTDGHRALDDRKFEQVARYLPEIEDLLHRGVECGALVDPWNVVGFGGNFSLFPAIENTVHDYRVDDLILLMEQILDLTSRACTEAAAIDDEQHEDQFSRILSRLSQWWDQFATSSVSGVQRLVAEDTEISTNLVAGALNAWHKAGAAAGDIGFWRMFVEQFDNAKAFQLVIEALLDQDDLVASMALMMQWVSQSDYTPLDDGDASLYPLAERWLQMVEAHQTNSGSDQWPLTEKFFAHLEASAEENWYAPEFRLDADGRRIADESRGHYLDEDIPFGDPLDLGGESTSELDERLAGELPEELSEGFDDLDEDGEYFDELMGEDAPSMEPDEGDYGEDDELDNLFSAAYDDVTFRDSTDDGMDSAIFDPYEQSETTDELEAEAERIQQRLGLLTMIARLWKRSAITWGGFTDASSTGSSHRDRQELFGAWQHEASNRYTQLGQLLQAVHKHRIPAPRGSHESMVEYDRRRVVKDSLLERIMATSVEMSDAARLLRAAAADKPAPEASATPIGRTIEMIRSVLVGDASGVVEHWVPFCRLLAAEELLYVPLGKGGDPGKIVKARALHRLIHDLLGWLPRLGLVKETCELLDIAQRMETEHPVGPGAVTEYDRLFENGYQAVVRCLVASADAWDNDTAAAVTVSVATSSAGTEIVPSTGDSRPSDGMLFQAILDLTESQLNRWLRHSKTVRLSVVERLATRADWDRFVKFIGRYGADLFTQRFLSLGNLRAILHQGVSVWLDNQRQDEESSDLRLVDELDGPLSFQQAVEMLSIAIEAVVENYREYRDYNSTTTQSDRGELLHCFIDFLRLRTAYDRISWNLKPVFLAHEILVRQGRLAAAEMWRRDVAQRTSEQADAFQDQLAKLCEQYGMRLPSVSERLSERFVRPLTIDRLRALVEPAMKAINESASQGEPEETNPPMAVMQDELDSLMAEPCGSGLDVPDWIDALEEEVTRVRHESRRDSASDDPLSRVEQVQLGWESLQSQLRAADPT